MEIYVLVLVSVLAICVRGSTSGQFEDKEPDLADLTEEELEPFLELQRLRDDDQDAERRGEALENYQNAGLEEALRGLDGDFDIRGEDGDNDDKSADLSEEELNRITEALDNDDENEKRSWSWLASFARHFGTFISNIAKVTAKLLSRLSGAFKAIGNQVVSVSNKISSALKKTSWTSVLDLVGYLDQVKRLAEEAKKKIEKETGDMRKAALEVLKELEELQKTLPQAIRDHRKDVCKLTKCSSSSQCKRRRCGSCRGKSSGFWSWKRTRYYCS